MMREHAYVLSICVARDAQPRRFALLQANRQHIMGNSNIFNIPNSYNCTSVLSPEFTTCGLGSRSSCASFQPVKSKVPQRHPPPRHRHRPHPDHDPDIVPESAPEGLSSQYRPMYRNIPCPWPCNCPNGSPMRNGSMIRPIIHLAVHGHGYSTHMKDEMRRGEMRRA